MGFQELLQDKRIPRLPKTFEEKNNITQIRCLNVPLHASYLDKHMDENLSTSDHTQL